MTQRPSPKSERHVVLVAPRIHWNTGNIGRTCLGTGTRLHLIEPLGFSLEHAHVKRAGLDYWPRVNLSRWQDFEAFESALQPKQGEMALFSKMGPRSYWEIPPAAAGRLFLVFGSETEGLPADICGRYPERLFHIPINREIRSLNLSTAVGIALFESLRPLAPPNDWVA